jgi:hypothetical protein
MQKVRAIALSVSKYCGIVSFLKNYTVTPRLTQLCKNRCVPCMFV